ncbi:MAG: SCP2 sterol-binding domain-containing protein [Ruminococcaceae bacterium]|nr:SCP2 sterol-binding domain-containing protein [Oscillospiraceae bacterium]
MTYEQVVAKVKAKFADADASSIEGTQAIQINLEGKNVEGIFYIEAKDGKVNVEPYDYHDNWATVTIAPTNLLKILDGKLDPAAAYAADKVVINGSADAVMRILKLAK